MISLKNLNIKDIEILDLFSSNGLNKIEAEGVINSYEIGQAISSKAIISNSIQIIIEGEARLLCIDGENFFTANKLKRGDIIGLASILNAKGSEEVNASSKLIAISLPDHLVVELYNLEENFKKWCDKQFFPSEALGFTELVIQQTPKLELKPKEIFSKIYNNGSILIRDNKELIKLSEVDYILIWGANSKNLNSSEQLISTTNVEVNGPFPTRFITLSKKLFNYLSSKKQINEENTKTINPNLTIQPAIPLPEKTSLDIGQKEKQDKFEIIRGNGIYLESLACIQMMAKLLKVPFKRDNVEILLRNEVNAGKKPSLELIAGILTIAGLHTTGAKVPLRYGTRLQTPSIISWKESYAVVKESNASGLILASPKHGLININYDSFEDNFGESISIIIVDKTNITPEQKFGFEWFWPSLKKYKGTLIQVLIASFIVQLFTLANPLLIQVIIDKVISQRSLDTLQILGVALVFVTILGGLLSSLRTFLFTETTNRIDTRLGAEVIDHLLRLPLNYFDKRPVGELSTRIAELEKIRNFLTGQALTTILDAAFSIIYILVMFLYSWLLTIIALIVVPIQIGLTLLGTPLIRRQLKEVAIKNANTSSHLVEVLTGVQTVKAQNIETQSRWRWQRLYNQYISKSFEKTITGTALNEISNVLQQLSQLFVLWVGATLVLKGSLTLGQLIAFRIISGYVTQPILRLSYIWQSVQELRVSFQRLGDIIDTPEESNDADKAKIPLPEIKGNVKFENLSFSFNQSKETILRDINLEIKQGTFVGIAGQSGSGKSTLMKLLPRLYNPISGKILIDDYDISKVELYSLRKQIGIVPQDPLLFKGSISDNIALTNPDVSNDEIVKAARTANAHEFIMQLPMGYSSEVGERGSALSGGQRQRIAIARTLLNKPKLLILDEATSALDYITERNVCENLRKETTGFTVFFITHRLNTIKNADKIILLHQGIISEVGSHNELMAKAGRYKTLYNQQDSQ